jgi:F0F1-type ATP synthase membrane subunit c/vacuolar-type H+-ATPase subunit K
VIRSLFSFRTLSVLAAVAVTAFVADFASAQEATGGRSLIDLTSAFSVAIVVFGAAYGISKLAAAAYESMSRQPEVIARRVCSRPAGGWRNRGSRRYNRS